MPQEKITNFALRKLKVQNFKALDMFEIEFPLPRMKQDPDVIVMGSKNGLGKTSVLESCGLIFLAAIADKKTFELNKYAFPVDLYDLLIHTDADKSLIEGRFQINDDFIDVKLSFDRDGNFEIKGNNEIFKELLHLSEYHHEKTAHRLFFSLAGLDCEPLFLPSLMYFHSYRKVQEGNLPLGMLVMEKEKSYHRYAGYMPDYSHPISTFKLEVLRSMMYQAGLFENRQQNQFENQEAEEILKKLNRLVKQYAGGIIKKLRPSPDNTLNFRITPHGRGESFTFDGLSSGQKEIISTLFLIWRYSKDFPSIVLIDEPELHLNAEWHRDFVQQVCELAPQNQYIIATHSMEVFSSVPKDRRLLLETGDSQK